MWFDPGLAGLYITLTLLHLGEDINLLVVSTITHKIKATRITVEQAKIYGTFDVS
jgi:hypothetical protein